MSPIKLLDGYVSDQTITLYKYNINNTIRIDSRVGKYHRS